MEAEEEETCTCPDFSTTPPGSNTSTTKGPEVYGGISLKLSKKVNLNNLSKKEQPLKKRNLSKSEFPRAPRGMGGGQPETVKKKITLKRQCPSICTIYWGRQHIKSHHFRTGAGPRTVIKPRVWFCRGPRRVLSINDTVSHIKSPFNCVL